ncbi:MAG: TatD family deoxyribonuclease [Proteobacteria bacterium]|nr:TatD family deoxyribonuclease [Pseudomonadota bacterium]
MIDSHCHLLHEKYGPEAAQTRLQNAKMAGVTHCITIACERHEWQPALAFAAQTPNVGVALGIHPHHAGEGGQVTQTELLEHLQNPHVVAVGETGLDYFYTHAPKAEQIQSFHTHLHAAKQANLPVVVHTRDAEADTLAILKEHRGTPFVLHCFTGTLAMAEQAIELGGTISFSGILTFKKSQELRLIASHLPRDKILIETDAPYLAPEPHRSQQNQPALLPHTLATLAQVWQIPPAQAAQITVANTRRLFTRLPSA